MISITKAHFELFKMYCIKWITFFHLDSEWDIRFAYIKGEGDNGASCRWDIESKSATLVLYYPWNDNHGSFKDQKVDKEIIEEYALHEVLELLLCPLVCIAESRSFDPCIAEITRHSIINKLLYTYLKHPSTRIIHETSCKT